MELHMQFTARELMKQGHNVLVFYRDYSPAREEFALERGEHDGIPFVRMNNTFSDCLSFEKTYLSPLAVRAYKKVLNEFKPDLVHVQHLFALTMDIIDLTSEAGVPVVMTLNDYWMGCPREQRITASLQTCPEIDLDRCMHCLRRLWPNFFAEGKEGVPREKADEHDMNLLLAYHQTVRKALSRVDRLIAPSNFVKRIYERYGIPEHRISVVPHGLDKGPFLEMSRKRSSILRFGYIGSIIPSKGIHILLEAFKMIGGSDCSLHIWGEVRPFHKDTNYGYRLSVLARGWETSIHFHGRYENKDVAKVLSGIDVLVEPSIWYEAFPMTVREGFLAGCALIVSNFGGLAELVEEGTTGLFFNVGDSVDLSHKMKRLMDERETRRKLAESPKKVTSVEENVAVLNSIYRDVANR